MVEKDLKQLKADYQCIKDKNNLPDFEELNRDFFIEKLADVETECLAREIRKAIIDKFASYLRFIETFLQPANAPMFVLSIIKSVTNDEKKKLMEIYGELAKSEINAVALDLKFNEEKEIEFIQNSFKIWQKIKNELSIFIKKIEDNWDAKPEVNGKNYFG